MAVQQATGHEASSDGNAFSNSGDSGSSTPLAAVQAVQANQQGQKQQEDHVTEQQQPQPAVPDMTQLLQLLAYAPPDICTSAGVKLVPVAAQPLLFAHQGDSSAELQQLQQLADSAAASALASQGIRFVTDAAAASQVCDHLMACPILAFGVCCGSSSSSGKDAPVLLQVLAPPCVTGDVLVDAAVYVFDVRGQQDSQQQQSAALLTLLKILLEDVRVVKLVDDAAHVSGGCSLW
jgi:hypothetical protein